MGSYAKERARERLADLAGQGLDLPTLWRESNEILAPAVPHYMSPCWYTLDPASLLVTSHFQSELVQRHHGDPGQDGRPPQVAGRSPEIELSATWPPNNRSRIGSRGLSARCPRR